MYAELKAEAIYLAARSVIERMVRPIPLEIRVGASLHSAKEQDIVERNYQESAGHYFTVLSESQSAQEKAAALVGV